MNTEELRTYWMRGPEAYQEVIDQRKMEQLHAEHLDIERRLEKVRAVKCQCEKLDAHQCYVDKYDPVEIDDSKFCRCRCHKIAEQESLVD